MKHEKIEGKSRDGKGEKGREEHFSPLHRSSVSSRRKNFAKQILRRVEKGGGGGFKVPRAISMKRPLKGRRGARGDSF